VAAVQRPCLTPSTRTAATRFWTRRVFMAFVWFSKQTVITYTSSINHWMHLLQSRKLLLKYHLDEPCTCKGWHAYNQK
jgi:hypothetical protein